MTARLLEMRRKPLAEPCATTSALDERGLLALVQEAIRRTVGSQKAAAIDMGISEPYLSKQLAGLERLPLVQLAKVPAVQREFAFLLAERCGADVRRVADHERRRRRIRDLNRELLELMGEEERASA